MEQVKVAEESMALVGVAAESKEQVELALGSMELDWTKEWVRVVVELGFSTLQIKD